ncbi:MAG TPA: TolC family outer membrane protein [Ramlibacter sp.]|nr:TolC family outer membrane protein [Ramlibacter sp.]
MRSILSAVRAGRRPLAGVALACAAACGPLAAWSQAAAGSVPASSASANAASLTLSQAYQAALAQDAVIRAARATADVRRERLPQARAQLLPNVSAGLSRNKNKLTATQPGFFGPVTSDQDYFSSNRTLTIRQPIFRPFQFADYRQAEAQVADAEATLEKEVQNLAVRVAGAYLEALLADDQLALVMVQKQAYTTQLDAARKRFAGGAGVRTDVDEAQARLDLTLAQELEAKQNVDFTRRQLQVLVNVPVTKLAPLDERKLELVEPNPPRLQDWIDRAELTSPELRSLRAQAEASRREIEKARSGHLPTLDAIAQWSISQNDTVTQTNSRFDNKAIGLQLNVPLYSGGYVSSQTRQAVADLERAQEALEATRRDLGTRVEKEYRGITEGVLRVRALEQAVRSAETAVVSSRRSFEGGVRTIVDVLNAEQQQVSALKDLAQARYLYMISRVRLRSLAGEADAAAVDEINAWLKP